jgi:hypothetical protein
MKPLHEMLERVLHRTLKGALIGGVIWLVLGLFRLLDHVSMNEVIDNTLGATLIGAMFGSWVGIYREAKERRIHLPWQGILLGAGISGAAGAVYRILANLILHPRFDEAFFVEYATRPVLLLLTLAFNVDLMALRFACIGAIAGGLLAWIGRMKSKVS